MPLAEPAETTVTPRVGVGVIVQRNGRVLLGLRKGAHGAGSWALPGGHLEFGESVAACACREVLEETGLVISAPQPGPFVSDVFADIGRHYVTLFMLADSHSGEPALMEPDKCERWAWFDWAALPQPLFQPLRSLQATGFSPPPLR